jgi:hypothetical protein
MCWVREGRKRVVEWGWGREGAMLGRGLLGVAMWESRSQTHVRAVLCFNDRLIGPGIEAQEALSKVIQQVFYAFIPFDYKLDNTFLSYPQMFRVAAIHARYIMYQCPHVFYMWTTEPIELEARPLA